MRLRRLRAEVSRVEPLRHLGRLPLVAVGVNSVIGGGIFILPAVVAGRLGGVSLLAYVAAGAVVLGVGLSLATLAARFERSGGPYVYVAEAFGPFVGFQAGWLFSLARLTAMASLLHGFALYVGALVPWGGTLAARTALVGFCAAWVVGINIAGIRQTSGATSVLAVVKIAPLLLIAGAGAFHFDAGNIASVPVTPAGLLRAVLLLIFAFSGFEILTVPAEESLRPRRDMPVALIATILIVCALYLFVHAVCLGMLPRLASEKAPLAAAAAIIAGPAGRYAMTAAAAVSTAGCSLASLVGGTRMLYALSATRQIPGFIGALHPRFRTPLCASLLVGGAAAVMAVLGGYERLSAISAGTRMLVYLACCLACLRPATGAAPRRRAVALVTSGAIVVLLGALEPKEAVMGMMGVAVGMILYLIAYTFARPGGAADVAEGEAR